MLINQLQRVVRWGRREYPAPTRRGTWGWPDSPSGFYTHRGIRCRCPLGFWCVESSDSARWFDWAGERFRPTRWRPPPVVLCTSASDPVWTADATADSPAECPSFAPLCCPWAANRHRPVRPAGPRPACAPSSLPPATNTALTNRLPGTPPENLFRNHLQNLT